MPLVTSLLTAIVRADGDALVLHAGERPYVVSPSGQSELASRALTLDAMKGMLGELLTAESRSALEEYGAVQHDLPSGPFANERFTVVAARGGEDIWIEIRRHRTRNAPAAVVPPEPVAEPVPAPDHEPEALPRGEGEPPPLMETALPQGEGAPEPLVDTALPEPEGELEPLMDTAAQPEVEQEPRVEVEEAPAVEATAGTYIEPELAIEVETEMELDLEAEVTLDAEPESSPVPIAEPADGIAPSLETPEQVLSTPPDGQPVSGEPEPREVSLAAAEIDREAATQGRPANVLPLSRGHARPEPAPWFTPALHTTGIDRLLRIGAARGASTLYLTSQSRPSIRVDGQIAAIDGEPTLSEADVETLMLDIIPERNREALRSQTGTEWICDIPEVGRIRCVTFRDHRGAGAIIRMIPARAISAEQLALSREIQGLCAEVEGLVIVTGPRASGKSTLISAFVDLINRTRSDHVITLENQIKFVHENRLSLVSQREVRGDSEEVVSVARAALRENPDVLVIEDFGSAELALLALDAAQSGHLVIGALTAHTASEAVDRIIDQAPSDRRAKVQLALSENLRGVVAQVLLRRIGGGRVAAREVLLNTSAVAHLIAEGKTSQLPMAIDSGRKHGMLCLNDALVALVQGGIVDSREAYRQAADRPGFLALLKRQGIDTSSVERLA